MENNMEEIIRNNNEFVVIDIETSHFHPEKGAMIIELAAVKIKDGKIVDRRNQLLDPERKITKKITEITGITNEMLSGKPKFREVLPNFYSFLGDAVIVAHNAQFDWNRFLLFFLKKVGIYPKNQVVDTLALSRKYLKHKEGYKLEKVCNRVGIDLKDAHRALNDTIATAKLFLYIKNNFIDNTDNGKIETNQISALNNTEILNQTEVSNQNVRKVAYWEKQIAKNKYMKRLYVTLDRAVVFFDIPTKAWEVKASNEPINFTEVEKGVLSYLQLNDIEDLINYYN